MQSRQWSSVPLNPLEQLDCSAKPEHHKPADHASQGQPKVGATIGDRCARGRDQEEDAERDMQRSDDVQREFHGSLRQVLRPTLYGLPDVRGA